MRDLIKKILIEEMVSKIDEWESNVYSPEEGVFTTLISKDDNNGDKLYLFVGFEKINNDISKYSYCFMVVDTNNKPITGFMLKRDEVSRYIPNSIKNKRMVIPIILGLTRRLLTNIKPNKVIRTTHEVLDNNSLVRYDEITKIFINEFMYKLTKKGKNTDGTDFWVMELVDNIQENETTETEYLDIPPIEEINKKWEERLLSILPKLK